VIPVKRAEKREHLIEVATELFNRCGYHASGIDLVIAKARIAKTTLYRHFPSKEDLIVAVLKRIDAQYRDDMRQAVDGMTRGVKEKLLATFDVLEDWFRSKTFYGCPFMSAASEYNLRSSPVFHEVEMHKRLMIAYFEELARAAGFDEPARIGEEINLLHEGATAVTQVSGDPTTARRAKAMAARLIDATVEPGQD
jgi:AcrR family transcriptional regulator